MAETLTPMMRQYLDIKARYPDTLLLYRMGDFYELFQDDAVKAAKLLGLTLTQRNHGGKDATPLAGFPHHAIERYMPKLIGAGLKVAVCEQVEDPATAKGVVKRDVVEIVTRGTALSENYLDAKSNNYLAAVYPGEDAVGLAYLDLSTGVFGVAEGRLDQVVSELYRLDAKEVIWPETLAMSDAVERMRNEDGVTLSLLAKSLFHQEQGIATLCRHFGVHSLEAYGCEGYTVALRAAAAALHYAKDSKKTDLSHLSRLTPIRFDAHMALDATTVRNLELIRPIHGEDVSGTLFHWMDKTVTAMGGRMLKHWLTHPLLDLDAIRARQAAVAELSERRELLSALRGHLQGVNDIERIVARSGAARSHARDLVGLGHSLLEAAKAAEVCATVAAPLLREWASCLTGLLPLGESLLSKLTDRPPMTVREGGLIREGAFPELDQLNANIRDGREWLNSLQQREREATGIPTLKVGFNKVFGYYLEVTKTHEDKVPAHYLRKQSLVGAERYITPEMKEWESRILNAEGEINALEYKLFCALRDEVNAKSKDLLQAAAALGSLDTVACLALLAHERDLVKPEVVAEPVLEIEEGRHPVVEALCEPGTYIANDVRLSGHDRQILLITGPNMAGKSTYLRQVGLIVLLAQIGSFVPAARAKVGLADRIFTRVGASDRLAKGQSTFMVEMIETANILQNATPRSLVLLDEIGRGTSTYDGLSLAWAIVESLHETERLRARTLFATHYHELTRLAGKLARLRNVQVLVREEGHEVIFLRRVIEGACDSSYGIQVARMAGVPHGVIDRAWELLGELENGGTAHLGLGTAGAAPQGGAANAAGSTLLASARRGRPKIPSDVQLDIFGGLTQAPQAKVDPKLRGLYDAVMAIDISTTAPLQALMQLSEWQKRFASLPRQD
jgi:DNA mismatch repair protein MutS